MPSVEEKTEPPVSRRIESLITALESDSESEVSSGVCKRKKKTRFACLVTGNPPRRDLRARFGGYGDMMIEALTEERIEWTLFDVDIDGVPSMEELRSYDGIGITGSKCDAHDENTPWICDLRALIKSLYEGKKHKMFGICFGHQIIAHSLGGKSGRAAEFGWELGIRDLNVTTEMCRRFGWGTRKSLRLHECHQDQVTALPPGGVVLASSKRCPVEMFAVGDMVLGVQGHPDFTRRYQTMLMEHQAVHTKIADAIPALAQMKALTVPQEAENQVLN